MRRRSNALGPRKNLHLRKIFKLPGSAFPQPADLAILKHCIVCKSIVTRSQQMFFIAVVGRSTSTVLVALFSYFQDRPPLHIAPFDRKGRSSLIIFRNLTATEAER